eukprot:2318752-Amphidinium_carterae.1
MGTLIKRGGIEGQEEADALYTEYWEAVREALESELVDILEIMLEHAWEALDKNCNVEHDG